MDWLVDTTISGAAGTVENMIATLVNIQGHMAIGFEPPAGSQPGGRLAGSADTGAQNATQSAGAPSNSGTSYGAGTGTNNMPWPAENGNVDPGGSADNPLCNAGGSCTCSCIMPSK